MMSDVDKWSAEACGVGESTDVAGNPLWQYKGKGLLEYWTLSNPRCMQVFR